jgi:hypothetical protein
MLPYSYIDTNPLPLPPRQVNGGLYTGESAKGPWGNVPIEPEAHTMARKMVELGGGRERAVAQMPTSERPGNNRVILDGFYSDYDPQLYPTMKCMSDNLR